MKHLLFFGFLITTWAHICILNPPQRGPLSITVPGDDSCFRRTDYCGGVEYQGQVSEFLVNQKVEFLFQQNLNHWYQPNPGYFDISVTYNVESPVDKDWDVLATLDDFPAHEQVTQTNFTVSVRMPPKPADRAILRLRYHSNNPDEVSHNTTIFYNCADIRLIASTLKEDDSETSNTEESNQEQIKQQPFSCTSPTNFIAQAFENNNVGRVSHTIYYDADNSMIRWDRTGELEVSGEQSSIILINNYTSLMEYVIDPVGKSCQVYGPDAFYTWSYGIPRMGSFVGFWQAEDKKIGEWYNPSNKFRWQASVDGENCLPYALYTPHSAMNFWSVSKGEVTPNDFLIPVFCHSEKMKKKCSDNEERS